MHNEISIALIPDENIFSVIPLLRVLSPAIPEGVLRSRLTEMVSQGYLCAGAYSEDRLIGICGMWILALSWRPDAQGCAVFGFQHSPHEPEKTIS